MKKNIFSVILALLVFCSFGLLTSTQVRAADDPDVYDPSITIIKQESTGQVNPDGSQVYVPLPNVSFTIKRVDVSPSDANTPIDLSDKKTYVVSEYSGLNPVEINMVTNEQGQIVISGSENLPRGFYQITENSAGGQSLVIKLPYKDKNGNWLDDIIIYPKTSNPGTVVPPVEPGNPSQPEVPENPDEPDKDKNPNKPNETKPNNPVDSIIQTSGSIIELPIVTIAIIMFSLVIILWSIMVLWRRRKANSE